MLTRGYIFLLMFRIANLCVATFFLLCVILPDSWCHGPTDPAPPGPYNPADYLPIPMTERSVLLGTLVGAWFFSAAFWFVRSSFRSFCGLMSIVAWIVFLGIMIFRL